MLAKVRWSVSVSALLLLGACDARWHLIGEGTGPGAPRGTGGGPTGAGAQGAGGMTQGGIGGTGWAGGATPAGGTGGNAGASPARPLPISARDAVTKVAQLLWQSVPDAALLAEAESGTLTTTEDLRQLAVRLQSDPRSRSGIGGFYRWWLNLDRLASVEKDPNLFPRFNAELAAAMADETETFAVEVTVSTNGTFATLLTAPFSFLNEALAGVYGIDGIVGSALRRTPLNPQVRGGIFTQPAFLALNAHANSTSPTWRGLFLRNQLFCQPLPPPPPDVPTVLEPSGAFKTVRQMVAAHAANPACAGCHNYMDPLGFGYENFDSIGQYQTLENGSPIDASGYIAGTSTTFDGAMELAHALAVNPDTRSCMAKKWVEYGLGRSLTAADDATVTQAYGSFAAANFNLGQLIAGVIQTTGFLTAPPVCTPGADQTCNDSPAISSLHGRCTAAARCVCTIGEVNPTTGRCY